MTPKRLPDSARRVFLALVLGAALAGCSGLPFIGNEIRFSNAELSERLARRFPVEKSVAGFLDVTISNPRVAPRAESDQRFGAMFDIRVKVPLSGKTFIGSLAVSGKPRYDPATRSIFLTDARVDSVRADNMTDALSAALAKAASGAARDAFEDKPLHTFKPEDLRRYGLSINPTRVEVRPDGIALILN